MTTSPKDIRNPFEPLLDLQPIHTRALLQHPQNGKEIGILHHDRPLMSLATSHVPTGFAFPHPICHVKYPLQISHELIIGLQWSAYDRLVFIPIMH